MKLRRRQFLRLATGAVALPALSRIAGAQSYPSRPVRVIVPFAAGGGVDIIARLMGQWLSAAAVPADNAARAPAPCEIHFLDPRRYKANEGDRRRRRFD